MTHRKKQTVVTLALLMPSIGILLLHARYYWPFLSDDALISLRYADRLLEGKGLTWTEGRPVEGYSNLLWILLVALVGRLGIDLIHAARILGVLGMASAMFALSYRYAGAENIRDVWLPVSAGLFFLVLGAPIAVWAIGGLEAPLFGALLAAAIALTFSIIQSEGVPPSRVWYLSLVLGLLCLTRPDGPLFAVTTAASLVLAGPLSRRRISLSMPLLALVFPVTLSVAQLLFRLYYYGEAVPNTALVKITPSIAHWIGGRQYMESGIRALAPFSWLAMASLIALVLHPGTRAKGAFMMALAAAWSAYVVFIGGDIFPAYRHLIPLMIVFAFALVESAALVTRGLSARRVALFIVSATLFGLFVPYTQWQLTDKQNQRALRERWEWEGRDLALLLKAAFSKQQPLLAVTAAGCLPYWSEFPALDMLGLNDHYLPRHPPKDIGAGMLGHELGDGQYVLNSNPDIIVFNVGSPPAYRSGEELDRMQEFHERYVPVTIEIRPDGLQPIAYLNKYSEKIGIRRSDSSIVLPGFLLRGDKSHVRLNRASRLVVSVSAGDPVKLTFDVASAGGWYVDHVRASNPQGVDASLNQEDGTLTVTVRAIGAEPVEVQEVVLRRSANLIVQQKPV